MATKTNSGSKSGSAAKKQGGTQRKAKPKTPPVYGGVAGDPQMGANGRRLVAWMRATDEKTEFGGPFGPERTQQILEQARERTLKGRQAKGRPKNDRFIAWETIVAVAGIKDAPRLIRRLQRQPNAKAVGLGKQAA